MEKKRCQTNLFILSSLIISIYENIWWERKNSGEKKETFRVWNWFKNNFFFVSVGKNTFSKKSKKKKKKKTFRQKVFFLLKKSLGSLEVKKIKKKKTTHEKNIVFNLISHFNFFYFIFYSWTFFSTVEKTHCQYTSFLPK